MENEIEEKVEAPAGSKVESKAEPKVEEVEAVTKDMGQEAVIAALKAEVEAIKASAKEEVDKAKAEAAQAKAEAEFQILHAEVVGILNGLGVVNPEHAFKLLKDDLQVIAGKEVKRGDANVSLSEVIKGWVEGEGKYMLPASVPNGGAGIPGKVVPPASKQSFDLSTADGATAYARSVTHQ